MGCVPLSGLTETSLGNPSPSLSPLRGTHPINLNSIAPGRGVHLPHAAPETQPQCLRAPLAR